MRIGLFSRAGSSSSSPASRVRPATWRIQLAPCASSPASRVRLLAWRQFPRDSHPAARRTARPTRRRRLPRSPFGAPEPGSDGARRSTPRAHEDRPRRPPRRPQERGPATSSPRPGPKAPPSTTGARTRVCYAPFPLLRPFTLHCTRKRSAAEGEVSAAEGEAGAAAGNRYIESYVASAGLARRFRRFRRIQAVSSSTRAGARARKARPRWEIAFFSRALICAVVRPAPPGASSAAGTKTGS